MKPLYQLNIEDTIKELHTTSTGLNSDVIQTLQQEFGENKLKEALQKSKFSILISQFSDVMILILIIAAIISFFAGEHTDGFVILAIILGNAWLGYSQEHNAAESVRLLQKMSAQYALVLRDNNPLKIETEQLVPGDLLVLEAGDIVPADARLIEVNALSIDESSLTGESHPIDKNTELINETNLMPADQINMVFKGSIVNNGSAKAIVSAIGMSTELGKIAGLMETGSQKTPLQKRLSVFSQQLAMIVIVICLVVFGFGIWRGEPPLKMFLTALSLAVAALPEALPAVITIALAKGAHRMVKNKVLMRKLPAVETLGSVTYICSDKTGTLTQNIMTVEKIEAAEEKMDLLNHAMILSNEVKWSADNELIGDPTEKAMVNHSLENGFKKVESDAKFALVNKLPFDSERMRMSTLHQYNDKRILFVKGAPVKIMDVLSTQEKTQYETLFKKNDEWAAEGLRVLFFAYQIMDESKGEIHLEDENDLKFLGMVSMIDPPREEVLEAIKECEVAGIKTVMITGDQALTATAIAERLGILALGSKETKTGAELNEITEEEFRNITKNTKVYARVSPEQKLEIVKALQANGEFVAMTGDGVNDAPSLKQADIGVAMGITGTDVSKEAADMILLDDNFTSIVKAVREGRRIYENIKKFIQYVLSCNLGEILIIFLAPIIGFAIPLLPIHILWINLVTDGVPGLALVSEPAEKDIMTRQPKSPKENLFAGGLIKRILITALIMTASVLFVQWYAIQKGYDLRTQQTAVFTALCFVQLGNALSVRSMYHSLFSGGLFGNWQLWGAIILTVLLQLAIVYLPWMHKIFKTNSLDWSLMGVILLLTLFCTCCIEIFKYLNNRKTPH